MVILLKEFLDYWINLRDTYISYISATCSWERLDSSYLLFDINVMRSRDILRGNHYKWG